MFGMGFAELVVVLIVGTIVVGPQKLPSMMRTAAQWIARMRRATRDLRAQSGIDDLIRDEGLEAPLHELKALTGVNLVGSLSAQDLAQRLESSLQLTGEPLALPAAPQALAAARPQVLRAREYPVEGCDAYGVLPDDLVPYAATTAQAGPEPRPVTTSPSLLSQ